MDLREIEAKADEYLAEVLAASGDAAAGSWLYRLMALEHVAKIKQIAGQNADRVPSYNEIATDLNNVRLPDGRVIRKHVWSPGCCTISAEFGVHVEPDPVKPAVDRLHELVSYLRGQAEECRSDAAGKQDQSGQLARKQPEDYMAVVYDEAADKLEEILREGSL